MGAGPAQTGPAAPYAGTVALTDGATVYLDHAATTPLRPEARDAMAAHLGLVGNASSLHGPGRAARRVVEDARESIAADLGARPSDVIFTSGGTESDNLAIKGLFWSRFAVGNARRIVCSRIEHHAVLDAVTWLAETGQAEVTWVEADAVGRITPEALEAVIGDPADVTLVTGMWANNEVGTVSPIADLAAVAAGARIPFHTDAVQAAGQVPVDFTASGVDALSVTAHKVGGPLGIGALLVKPGVAITPLSHGGGQERDVRSGTFDPPAAAGFAAALRAAIADLEAESARIAELRHHLVRGVLAAVPDAALNGDPDLRSGPGAGRLPGNAHFSFPGCDGDSLLLLLDAEGIACSTGSACTAGVARPSHVLLGLGADPAQARSSLRFSLGHDTTQADVDALLACIGPVVDRARSAGARPAVLPARGAGRA